MKLTDVKIIRYLIFALLFGLLLTMFFSVKETEAFTHHKNKTGTTDADDEDAAYYASTTTTTTAAPTTTTTTTATPTASTGKTGKR